jgi:PAS domain-containing protein
MHFTVIGAIMIISAIIAFGLSAITANKNNIPGKLYFIFFLLAAGVWSLFAGFEDFVVSTDTKILMSQLSYLGVVSLTPFFLLFLVHFLQKENHLSTFLRVAIWIIPVIVLLGAVTNTFHGLVWPFIERHPVFPNTRVIYGTGLLKGMIVVYSYVLLLGSFILIFQKMRQIKGQERKQFLVLLIALVIPVFANFLYTTEILPGLIDITPVAFIFSGVIIAWDMLQYRFLQIMPVAWDNLFQIMDEGVLIFDKDYNLINANQSAEIIFELQSAEFAEINKYTSGKLKKLYSCLQGQKKYSELHLNGQTYQINQTPITTATGQNFGYLVVLLDISKEEKAHQELERQSRLRELLMEISTNYINIPLDEVDSALNSSLKQLAQFFKADRAYIFSYNFNTETCSNTHEWTADGIEPQIHNLQNVPFSSFPDWIETHCLNKTVFIPKVKDMA